jgi:branched-subunit amino acid aminotransferase/4-amino-4-deoxychorismate lyase
MNYNPSMAEPLAYLNGEFIPQSQANLPVNDAGLIWGATVTDLCRTFRHQLFRLADHLRRFRAGCQEARIPLGIADSELAALAHRLVEQNSRLIAAEQELALVLFATPGRIGYYLGRTGGPGEGPGTLCLHTFPLPFSRYARLFHQGANLLTPAVRQPPPESVPPTIKQRSRLHWWLAEQEVKAIEREASALLLNSHGLLTETAFANLCLVRNGKVCTPRRGMVLPGVSLRMVEELCADIGIQFLETELRLEECRDASEAFLSSTSFCLAPVARINDRDYPCPGPVFQQLLEEWSRRVGVDIRQQILSQADQNYL